MMDIHEVVIKLVGEINPVGETYTDNERFDNLQVITELVDILLDDINHVAENKTRDEASMKKAGKFASNFLGSINKGT